MYNKHGFSLFVGWVQNSMPLIRYRNNIVAGSWWLVHWIMCECRAAKDIEVQKKGQSAEWSNPVGTMRSVFMRQSIAVGQKTPATKWNSQTLRRLVSHTIYWYLSRNNFVFLSLFVSFFARLFLLWIFIMWYDFLLFPEWYEYERRHDVYDNHLFWCDDNRPSLVMICANSQTLAHWRFQSSLVFFT